jgi:adenylosuccinate lyase
MKRIFGDQNKFKRWLDVELAALKAWEELGTVPKGTYDRVKKKAKFTVKGIEDIEKTTNHDVIAFTTNVASYVGEDSKWIHLGLTSSDVVDTAQALILVEAVDEVVAGAETVLGLLKDLSIRYKDAVTIGRTHGVHAEPTTFGLRVAVWHAEMQRAIARLRAAREEIAVGKMSGAVGNFAHTPPELEEKVMSELGLSCDPVSSQVVQRDRHAFLMFALALLGGTLEKIAINLRTLQRTEIGEVMEPFGHGQKGSSAMPHKRNPVTLERITGLARILRANALAAAENQALWDERDISHSSVERVILPDSLTIADYILDKTAYVLKNLEVNVRRMELNTQATKGLYFSQTVLLKLVEKGVLRERAYEIVQRNAMKTHKEGIPFYDNLLKDSEVTKVLDRTELAECFSNKHFTRYVDYILERAGVLDAGRAKLKPDAAELKAPEKAKPASRSSSRNQQRKQEPAKPPEPPAKPAPMVVVEEPADAFAAHLAAPDPIIRSVRFGQSDPYPARHIPARQIAPVPLQDDRDSEAARRKRRKRPRRTRPAAPALGPAQPLIPPGNRRDEPEYEDYQPAQLEDWRNPAKSVVDTAFKRPGARQPRRTKKR